eukprot:313292_1
MFKIFYKIPKFDTNQLNQSNMSWFNSCQKYIISKCKSITNINLYYVSEYMSKHYCSTLSSFDALRSLIVSCDSFGQVELMKHFLSAIQKQSDLRNLTFHGKIDHTLRDVHEQDRNQIFRVYMHKYSELITSLCVENYGLQLSEILKSIITNCKQLKQLKLKRHAVRFVDDDESLSISICDEFVQYVNNHTDFVEFRVSDTEDECMRKLLYGILHGVQSCHFVLQWDMWDSFDRQFVINYISNYCAINDIIDIRHLSYFDRNINRDLAQVIKSNIVYKNTHILSKLETLCLIFSGVDKHILLWISLIILNAKNLNKITFINNDHWTYVGSYFEMIVRHCLENAQWMKFGILNEWMLKIFINVFDSYYKYYPIFKKQMKGTNNKIRYIELITDVKTFKSTVGRNIFDWKKTIIGMMKLMSLHEINWKVSIYYQGEMDDKFRSKIFDEIRYGRWPDYNRSKHSVWENTRFVNENGKEIGTYLFTCGIWRDSDFSIREQCDHY